MMDGNSSASTSLRDVLRPLVTAKWDSRVLAQSMTVTAMETPLSPPLADGNYRTSRLPDYTGQPPRSTPKPSQKVEKKKTRMLNSLHDALSVANSSGVQWTMLNGEEHHKLVCVIKSLNNSRSIVMTSDETFHVVENNTLNNTPPRAKLVRYAPTYVKQMQSVLLAFPPTVIGAYCEWNKRDNPTPGGFIIDVDHSSSGFGYQVVTPGSHCIENVDSARNDLRVIHGHARTQHLQTQLEQADAKQRSADASKDKEIARLQESVAAADALISRLSLQTQEMKKALEDEQNEHSTTQSIADDLYKKLAEYAATIEQLEQSSRPKPSDIETMQQELNTQADLITHLKQALAASQSETDKKQALINKLREKRVAQSAVFDESRAFPPTEDIINLFALTKQQFHSKAAKSIRSALQKLPQFAEWHKLRINKYVYRVLFDILIDCFATSAQYSISEYDRIADALCVDVNDPQVQQVLTKTFKERLTTFGKSAVETVLKNVEHNESGQLQQQTGAVLRAPRVVQYIEKCIEVCWQIVLARSPFMALKPMSFDSAEGSAIHFDDKIHEAGSGSELDDTLNFIVWPMVVLQGTNDTISLITAVFLNKIPDFSRKGLSIDV